MPLYEISNNDLKPLVGTNFQDQNLWERRDLQRLFKVNITVIDPDILVIAEEFGEWSEGSRRIDLLAVDKSANLVVVELKRTEDGGHMELQAIRYSAMVANMTWDFAVSVFKRFLSENEIELDAESRLCEFLSWDEPRKDDFAQNVRIILAAADFSKEITTSVLWLNERELDICCIRLSLHKIDTKLVLSAEQIIPLPEAEGYQIEVRQKKREARVSRGDSKDRSLYSIFYSDEVFECNFRKSDIGFNTVKLLENKGLIDEQVFSLLRDDTSCSFKLLKLQDEMTETETRYTKYRYRQDPEIIYEGKGYYIARNWGVSNTPKFIAKMESLFPSLKYSSDGN
jgi:hypothetical protein|tara:strand:+ start:20098 stop:21120 length:1023 start_codon:yes stop_codon:yes gene_type:complete